MQIRCAACTKTVALDRSGELPAVCPHCAQAPVPGPFGDYQPLRLIAAGGMGEVFLARHRELGTEVALKVLPAIALDAVSSVRARFAREARLTAKVSHAGVVKVHGCEVLGDRPYLVLEFVAGETLRQRLRGGPLPIVDAARIVAATADVLTAAHQEGVLHRDIKPDNVMVEPDGSVRVLDFGIARAISDEAPLTRTGEILGTPEYMAPEQLLEGPEGSDARTDVHALGILLYELSTGHSPFRGSNLFQALKLVESLVPPAPSSLQRAVPPALDAVVQKALQKRPEDRFASAAAFATAVRDAVPAVRAPAAAGPSFWTWGFWLPLAAVLLVGAIGIVVLLLHTAPALVAGLGVGLTAGLATNSAAGAAPALVAHLMAEQLLAAGQWSRALVVAEHAFGDGDDAMRPLAQEAFVLAHVAWPLVAGAPAWLGACDETQRQRLFGDALEPAVDDDAVQQAERALLAGDASMALGHLARCPDSTTVWRLRLLAHHAAGDLQALPAAEREVIERADEALASLLGARSQPPAQQAAALAAYAQRLPIEAPEHWLARTLERHRRGDDAGGKQAAEMAWLSGAGELAVLLDAGCATIATGDRQLRRLDASTFAGVLRRVTAAEAADSPASNLLGLLLEATHSPSWRHELDRARTWPTPMRAAAAAWFVAAATNASDAHDVLLWIATALGATPDYQTSPWQDAAADARAHFDTEARRAR